MSAWWSLARHTLFFAGAGLTWWAVRRGAAIPNQGDASLLESFMALIQTGLGIVIVLISLVWWIVAAI